MTYDSSHSLWPFPSTHWSLVEQLSNPNDEVRRQAMTDLLTRYIPPLRSHLVIARKLKPDHAADLLQAFIASRVLEGEMLLQADRQRGRLRTFLATALDRFVANQIRDAASQKRSPSGAIPLEDNGHAAQDGGPHEIFELEWARHVLDETLRRMEQECRSTGRDSVWKIFQRRIVQPMRDNTAPAPYAEIVQELAFVSPGQAASALIRARQLFVRILRGVVGEYARGPEEIDAEIADLWKILSRRPA